MHRPHLDIRREVLPQFQLRQCLTLSEVQTLKISPARAEVEIPLLAGSVLLVKIDATRRPPLADCRDILICGNALLVARNLSGCVFGPFLIFCGDRETEAGALATQTD